MELTKQTLHRHSDHKHSVRYDGQGDSGDKTVLRGLYIPRALLPSPIPQRVIVTVQFPQD